MDSSLFLSARIDRLERTQQKCAELRRMKGYKNGGEGEGEMRYLRGKDTAEGFKAVNPPFLKGFFLPRLPLDNAKAQTHSKRHPAIFQDISYSLKCNKVNTLII